LSLIAPRSERSVRGANSDNLGQPTNSKLTDI